MNNIVVTETEGVDVTVTEVVSGNYVSINGVDHFLQFSDVLGAGYEGVWDSSDR